MNPSASTDMRRDLEADVSADRLLDRLDNEAAGIGCDWLEMPRTADLPAPGSCSRATACAVVVQR